MKCLNCGLSQKEVHITYDGYESSRVVRSCGYWIDKCNDINCLVCAVMDGHTFVKLSSKHKWVN